MASDPITEMSGLTKVHVGVVVGTAAVTVIGIIFNSRILGCLGFAFLIGTALTAALDDPETEEPLGLPIRITIGFAMGVIFGLILFAAGDVWN